MIKVFSTIANGLARAVGLDGTVKTIREIIKINDTTPWEDVDDRWAFAIALGARLAAAYAIFKLGPEFLAIFQSL